MISTISYGDKLDRYVESHNLIPYRLHKNSRYRTNCYYWIDYYDKWFKVEEVEYDFDKPIPELDHVIGVWMDNMQSYICTDLSLRDYRLERDNNCIREAEIINSKESFAGGEIEYWLFKHHVNFINKTYREFAPFIDRTSDSCIDPNKFYFVKADIIKGAYRNVRFVLDSSQQKFNQPPRRKKENLQTYTIDITKEEIAYQKKKRRKKHEGSNRSEVRR